MDESVFEEVGSCWELCVGGCVGVELAEPDDSCECADLCEVGAGV